MSLQPEHEHHLASEDDRALADRDSLAALVVRLKEALEPIIRELDTGSLYNDYDEGVRMLGVGHKALALVPADLADKVLVRAIDAAVIDDNGRLERANAALEAENRALRGIVTMCIKELRILGGHNFHIMRTIELAEKTLAPKEGNAP